MRRLLERRLASIPPDDDPRARFLARVVGPISAELLSRLDAPIRPAAVLVPVIERPAGPALLLTERAEHLKHHPGQISFPGGRLDHPGEGVVEAALREAREEVGLEPRDVTVVGRLPELITGTGFRVSPVVGWVADRFEALPDPAEVRTAFEVPLAFLLEPDRARERYAERLGTRFVSHEFAYAEHRIWGATAAIIMSLIEAINEEKTVE